jgi:serine/threonine protein kinase
MHFVLFTIGHYSLVCGTPGYVAPELIVQHGHSFAADNWSLGILIYEMVTGENPFYFRGMDQMALFKSIVRDPYEPMRKGSRLVRDLIDRLFVKDPIFRLGSLAGGESEILDHVWFRTELNRAQYCSRRLPAPWIPKISNPLDLSNFEDWSDSTDRLEHRSPRLPATRAAIFDGF